jgi:DNA-binding MarR family transcriptional regulator
MATELRPDRPQLNEAELDSWRGLLRAHSSLVKALDAELEQAHGLALSSYEVLVRLGNSEDGRMRMCDLADSVLLSRSGLTRLVDRLEREGLVARGSCEHDARGAFAVITPAGRATLDGARPTHLDGVRRHFLDCFDAAELETLRGFWQRLTAA